MSEVTVTVEMDPAEEQLEGLPDGPHVEIAFEALNDTIENVTGVESLTQAQLYMQPILAANGLITNADRVNGMEGFFSAIGSGAQKTWDYIKKMFAAIWGFFFKKEAPALAKEAKASAAAAKADLAIGDVGKAKASLSRAVGALKAGSSDSKELDELSEEISKASSKSDIEHAAGKVGKKNEKARKVLTHKLGNLIEIFKALVALASQAEAKVKALDTVEYTHYVNVLKEEHGDLTKGLQYLESIRDLEDLPKARIFLDDITGFITEIEKDVKSISDKEGEFKHAIESTEQYVGRIAEGDADKKKDANKTLTGLREAMALAAKHSQLLKRMMEDAKSINKSIPNVFGL